MQFLQIASFYPAYLQNFYGCSLDLAEASFTAQIDALLADGFGGGHLIAPAMRTTGFEPTLVITNAVPAQGQWAMEHGFAAPRSDADLRALVARQIEMIAPDVLYVLDPIAFDGRFIAALRVRPRLVVGWRAANIPAGVTWDGFDLMLSSDEGCRKRALELGAKAVANFRPGFPKAIADKVAATPKTSDIVFCGQITVEHGQRLTAMHELLNNLSSQPNFSAAMHLGLPRDARLPEVMRRYDKGSVWGLEMYRAVRSGRIAPNFHIDLATTRNQNMRILETTGVGTLLLTEHDPLLHHTFTPGREVETYANQGELAEKVRYYLDHAEEREDIARRGQERCFTEHSMERRAETLTAIIHEHIDRTSVAVSQRPSIELADVATVSTTPQIQVAIGHLIAGRINDAAGVLNALIQKDSGNAHAMHLLGRVAFLVGETNSAMELLQTALALKLPPETAWICAGDLSAALVKLGQKADAIVALRQAYALHSKGAGVAERLIALLNEAGAVDEAELIRARLPKSNGLTIHDLDSLIDLRHFGLGGPTPSHTSGSAASMSVSNQNTIDLGKVFPNVVFGDGVQCIGVNSTRIGRGTVVGDGSWLNVCIRDGQPRIVIGESVLIGRRAVVSSGSYAEVGSYTIFGPNVYVASVEHEYNGNHLKPILMCGIRDLGRVVIEENCWLGMNAIVDGNITVGRGSVVGANSVLRRTIPPFSVAVGIPAKVVRMLNPESNEWEPTPTEADVARVEAARKRQPFPDRAAYKAILDKANQGAPVHPIVAGRSLHLP